MERSDFEQWKGREVARLLALVETERRYYQEMVAVLPVALAVLAADRSIVSANRAFRTQFGLRPEDMRGKTIEQVLPSNQLIEKIRDLNLHGIAQPGFLLEIDGKLLRMAVIPIRNWDDEMAQETLLMVGDVSDVHAMGQASVVPVVPTDTLATDELPAIVWRADAKSLQFTAVRGSVEEILGYPARHWIDTPGFFAERIHPEDRDATLEFYRAAIAAGRSGSAEYRAVSTTGEAMWCRETLSAAKDGAVNGVITAFGPRKQIEQQRMTLERHNALLGLSARLAHDLNNPLMIITGYAEEMLHGMASHDPRRADLEQILTATQRIGGVTGQLLQFTRKQSADTQKMELGSVIAGCEERVASAAGDAVTLVVERGAAAWAQVNRQQLEEILILLVAPSREDARERTRVTIGSDVAVVGEQLAGAPILSGAYACITLHDDGRGADALRRAAVFEAILMKDAGRDTAEASGPALARAYSIVRDWGGNLAFSSEPFHGSTFTLYLPLLEEVKATTPAVALPLEVVVEEAPLQELEQQRETILVVDDEPGIRALVAKILRRERYNVLEAGSAAEALRVASTCEQPLQLLLTDVMLPDHNGRELAEKLREVITGLKVLYISGFTDDESVRTADFAAGSQFLQKPFTLGALVSKVREALL